MSDSPPERDMEWSNAGIEGSYKFLNRVSSFFSQISQNASGEDQKLKTLIHITIKDVTADIECFAYNKAIARLRTLFNAMETSKPSATLYDCCQIFLTTI